jgi:hypothetical protein
VIATGIGIVAMRRKARTSGVPLWSGVGRRFAQALLPAFVAAAALTVAAVVDGREDRLPGTWLLLYGAGVLAGASASIRVLIAMGLSFMALGLAALVLPVQFGTLCLGAGFGGIQIIFGIVIARKHGG